MAFIQKGRVNMMTCIRKTIEIFGLAAAVILLVLPKISYADMCSVNPVLENQYLFDDPGHMAVLDNGNFLFVADTWGKGLNVVDRKTYAVVFRIDLDFEPCDIVVDQEKKLAYISAWFDNRIAVLDVSDPLPENFAFAGAVEFDTQTVSKGIGALGLDSTGRFLYAADMVNSQVFVVDTHDGDLPYGVLKDPSSRLTLISDIIAVNSLIFVSDEVANTVAVFDADSRDHVKNIGVPSAPLSLEHSPDGGKIFTANSGDASVSIIDTETLTLSQTAKNQNLLYAPAALVYADDRLYIADRSEEKIVVFNPEIDDFELGTCSVMGSRLKDIVYDGNAGVFYVSHGNGVDYLSFQQDLSVYVKQGEDDNFHKVNDMLLVPEENFELEIKGGTGPFEVSGTGALTAEPAVLSTDPQVFSDRVFKVTGPKVEGHAALYVTDQTSGEVLTLSLRVGLPLTLSPSGPVAMEINGRSRVFSAKGGFPPYSWQVKKGMLSSTSAAYVVYTPSVTGTDTVKVCDAAGKCRSASVQVNLSGMTITPAAGFLLPGEEKEFSLLGAGPDCQWDAPLGGDIVAEQNDSVTYKAPGITGEYALVATDRLSGEHVRAIITVVENHLEITPQIAVLERSGSQHFSVSGGMPPYIWTVDQGDLNTTTGAGVFYTSPGITGQYVITARDAGGRTVSGQINVKGDFRISPVVSVALPGEEIRFSLMGASGDPSWVAEAGSFTSTGWTEAVLKAPQQTGTYDITAMDPGGNIAWSRVHVVDDSLFIQGAGESVIFGDTVSLSVSGGIGPYAWTASQGLLSATSGSRITWIAPEPGSVNKENGESLNSETVMITVSDSMGSVAAEKVAVEAEALRPLSVTTDSLSIPLENKGMIPVIGGKAVTAVSSDSSIAGCTAGDNQVIIAANALGSAVITISDGSGRSFDVPITVTGKKLAVIVAGSGPYPGNALWDHTLACAQNAFRVLLAQGYTSDTIHLLSADAAADMDFNGDGISNDIDAFADSEGLRNALTNWAAGAEDLFVYMTGHGSDQSFRLNPDTFLGASDLAPWLDQIGNSIDGKLVFLYDACRSGSFLPPLKGEKRIIIASAGEDEPAYFTSMGSLSFSNFFFDGVFNGAGVLDACLLAKNAIEYTYSSQHPLFDDNGNGIGNDDNDGAIAREMIIGSGITSAADIPLIKEISGETVISTGESAEIYADTILSGQPLDRVWAVITPPGEEMNDPDEPVLNLPVVELSRDDSGTRYQGSFDGFSKPGIYNIAVFARDNEGGVSMPKQTRAIAMNGTGACVSAFDSLDLFFPCVSVGSETLRFSMDYISGLTWQLNADSLAAAVSDQGCITAENDFSLYIPCCRYSSGTLSFNMTNTGGLNWSMDPESLVVE